MIREINLLPWKTVVVTSDFDKSEIKNIMLILAEIDNCYYYLEEWDEKYLIFHKCQTILKWIG